MSNEILSDLLLEYDQKKRKAELDLEKRKQELYEKVPRLQEIEDSLNTFAIATAKNILNGNTTSFNELNLKVENLKKEKEKILQENNIPKEFLEPYYECKICKDTGYIQTQNSASAMCPCLKQKLLDISYNKSNISNLSKENFETFNPNIFSDSINPEKYRLNISPRNNIINIKSKCIDFVNNFDNPDTKNLLFTGNTGLGKTFMCNCIAKSLLDKGHLVIYQTAFKMFEIIEDYKFKNADSHISKENYENLFDCDLLIIDDLGTELTNSFTNSELFNILNTRLLSGKKTIISTNLSPMQLGSNYAQRIFSRIFDRFKMVKFIGKDLRWESKQ